MTSRSKMEDCVKVVVVAKENAEVNSCGFQAVYINLANNMQKYLLLGGPIDAKEDKLSGSQIHSSSLKRKKKKKRQKSKTGPMDGEEAYNTAVYLPWSVGQCVKKRRCCEKENPGVTNGFAGKKWSTERRAGRVLRERL